MLGSFINFIQDQYVKIPTALKDSGVNPRHDSSLGSRTYLKEIEFRFNHMNADLFRLLTKDYHLLSKMKR